MAEFTGFCRDMPAFLSELKDNNERAWFEANRERFEASCIEPCLSFINAVGSELAKFDPPHKAVAKTNGSLRRIYRDTRFSKDKTPYHAFLHLIFWAGAHPNKSPGLHLIFSPGGLGIGAGQWQLSPEELKRYRAAVQKEDSCAMLLDAIAQAKRAKCYLEAPALKRVPRDCTANQHNESLIRQKGIVVRNRNEDYPDGFFEEGSVSMLLGRLRLLLPLEKWLVEHVVV